MKHTLAVRSIYLAIFMFLPCACGQEVKTMKVFDLSRQEVIDNTLTPYDGISTTGVDTSTLDGKVMCGYQGWFACPGDGSGKGWAHWAESVRGEFQAFKPGHCSIDIWPDMSEYDNDEKYATAFKYSDGKRASVYSSLNRKSVVRHFKWMKDYGIDGVFLQRFACEIYGAIKPYHLNVVLANCRAGANIHGRTYAVMYDLSWDRPGQIERVIRDWKILVDNFKITKDANDKAYLHHKGKPVVGLWGIGFKDRPYTLAECDKLVDFFKNDPVYGNCTVLLGVPTYWRTLNVDCLADKKVHEIIGKADIVSPWMVGRFRTPADVANIANKIWKPDVQWCKEKGKDYLLVVWPGFSWTNLMNDPSKFNQIPRLKGRFLWKQYVEACKSGCTMVYQAMFDEVDEATAIFKCTDNPPVGKSKFLTMEGLPSDHYLWLTGQGKKMLNGEIEITEEMPSRR